MRRGSLLRGRYRIDEPFASGATSTVYTAYDVLLRRAVAVKVMPWALDRDVRAQPLLAEAHVAASFDDAALSTVFDAGTHRTEDGQVVEFVVMQLVRGGDLRGKMLHGQLPWRDVAALGVDISDGLAQLHRRGCLHRDVKPSNILVVGRGPDGRLRAKLTDFGISSTPDRLVDGSLGTAAYVSPEQVRGHGPTEQSDVYSLGLVLIEALTGELAFPGPPDLTLVSRLHHEPYVPASVPPPLAELLRSITATDPRRRPSATYAGLRLRDLLTDDLVRSRGTDAALADRDEAARTSVLDGYDVLGWPPGHSFLTCTILATKLLSAAHSCVVVPMAEGLRVVSQTRGAELPALLGGSGWLVDPELDGPWAVEDLDGVRAQTVVPWVRSVAGSPLITAQGERLGTLCVLDSGPRRFTRSSLEDLAALGSLVVREMALRNAARRAALAR